MTRSQFLLASFPHPPALRSPSVAGHVRFAVASTVLQGFGFHLGGFSSRKKKADESTDLLTSMADSAAGRICFHLPER